MIDPIAYELAYLGLVLVVDLTTQERSWAGTAIFFPHRVIYGSGTTPDAALQSLVANAHHEELSLIVTISCLDVVADDLLQLVVRRSESATHKASSWIGTGRFRRRWLWGQPRTIVVTAADPEEAIEGLLLKLKGQAVTNGNTKAT